MGRFITWGERFLRKRFSEKIGGILLSLSLVVITFFVTFLIINFSFRLHKFFGLGVSIFLGYTTISVKSLLEAANKIKQELVRKNLPRARINLSHIVARDTDNLSEGEVIRATVESVAENTTDGLIAPLFYLGLGGVPLAMTYKAVNTLDSMIGYRNERYINFGRLAARVDEVANFIPARITSFMLSLAAFLSGFNYREGLRFLKQNIFKSESTNSVLTEGTLAHILGVKLGGINYYEGSPCQKPYLGGRSRPLKIEDINAANKLAFLSGLIWVAVILFIKLLLR
jgi:adenosylcobinamide-phosphate synthase